MPVWSVLHVVMHVSFCDCMWHMFCAHCLIFVLCSVWLLLLRVTLICCEHLVTNSEVSFVRDLGPRLISCTLQISHAHSIIWTDFPRLFQHYCLTDLITVSYMNINTDMWKLSLLWVCRSRCAGGGLSCVWEKFISYMAHLFNTFWGHTGRRLLSAIDSSCSHIK